MSKSDLIERIRNILAKTEANGATEAEAQTAASMAQKLMDEHNIAQADVEIDSPEASPIGVEDLYENKSLPQHYRFVLAVLDEAFAVETVITSKVKRNLYSRRQRRVGNTVVKIVGDPANVEAARWMLKYLAPIFQSLWVQYRVETGADRSMMAGFYAGLRHGLVQRLKSERKQREQEHAGTGTALAVINDRVEQAFFEAFPDVKFSRPNVDMDAYADGVNQSHNINLNKPLGDGSDDARAPRSLPR